MKKEIYDRVLSDSEKLAVQMFVENELQREAVRKILLFKLRNVGVEMPGEPSISLEHNFAFEAVANYPESVNNEKLGEDVRAKWQAARMIANAFDDLAKFKKESERSSKEGNKAI